MKKYLVSPWAKRSIGNRTIRIRYLLVTEPDWYQIDYNVWLHACIERKTRSTRWGYLVIWKDKPNRRSKTLRFEGFTYSEEKSKAIVDKHLSEIKQLKLLDKQQFDRLKAFL